MSFSISGIFKPAKQAPTANDAVTKINPINAGLDKPTDAEKAEKKHGNGGSCCGGCGGKG